ncbi:52 kDa repressor of the inhibitor of the protein kinase-like [Melanaphis sacchari]|uniref:52 kDa repressor of the inhibitor of the protein kinase-like n=1 Tax=Melanaphis sacchari TaxID=742174 RepID=UPI000DC13C10|nr:52 kDa repressor of the inhibitor of the protein kinase-like [Melanaphis sacchari]
MTSNKRGGPKITEFFSKKSKSSTDSQHQHSVNDSHFDPLDIGYFLNKSPALFNENRYNLIKKPWIPSENFQFPVVVQGNKNRKFQKDWLNKFPWLSYSAKDSGAYCRICVLFGRDFGGILTQKTIREDFIKFLKVVDLSGEALGKTISELLEQSGLSLTNLRGQSYDGAANMSGKFKGTQAYISKHQPLATYVHCYSHCLNLVLVKAYSVQPVRNTIGIVEEVINFIRDSPKRLDIFKSKNKKHCPNLNSDILIKLCAPRWVEHHEAFIRLNLMLPAIISFFEYMIECSDGQVLTKVNGLYNSILRFDFLLTLQIIINTMNITLPLSRELQTSTFDISEAQTLIQSALTVLTNQRNENDLKDIFKKSEDLANRFNIEVKISRIANKQRNRLNISSESNTPENAALLFTTYLPGTFNELEGELKTWKAIWKEKPVDKLPAIALETIFLPLMNYYPNIKRLLMLFATIPVTTCMSERLFSSLKRIKTYLKSTMGESRLNGLVLLNIHPEIIIKPEEVVDTYANKHPRCLQLL